jgi:hypothetical protein
MNNKQLEAVVKAIQRNITVMAHESSPLSFSFSTNFLNAAKAAIDVYEENAWLSIEENNLKEITGYFPEFLIYRDGIEHMYFDVEKFCWANRNFDKIYDALEPTHFQYITPPKGE